MGSTEAELKPKMQKLLEIFAKGDESGMAKRLFDRFLAKQNKVTYFDDNALNAAASKHQNIRDFCDRALNAPRPFYRPTGNIRIHQALKTANWGVNKINPLVDLGAPAFNKGATLLKYTLLATQDFNNGLGVMINDVQYVYIVARNYYYSKSDNKYYLVLMYIFYDVFGLDDDDLVEYGVITPSNIGLPSQEGVTTWWQLQHQHGYAPLVTRIVVINSYEVSAI